MHVWLKESKITHWWVAKSSLKMAFVNILSGEPLGEDLLVVGYLDRTNEEIATSTNTVVRVTEKGVITRKGTFYPFEQAHDLYLQFLIEANKENTLIATNWKYVNKLCKNEIIADIVRKDGIEEGVKFDFAPYPRGGLNFIGYSKKLSSNIVITTFARRDVCIAFGIPDSVKEDILRMSFAFEDETIERVRLIKNIFAEKFK